MSFVQKTNHQGKQILIFDFALKDKETVFKILEEGKTEVAKHPLSSLYVLTDVSGLRFNTDISEAFKDFAAHNKPYIKASALVGITGLQKIAYTAIMTFTKRNIPIFPTREEALNWLAKQ